MMKTEGLDYRCLSEKKIPISRDAFPVFSKFWHRIAVTYDEYVHYVPICCINVHPSQARNLFVTVYKNYWGWLFQFGYNQLRVWGWNLLKIDFSISCQHFLQTWKFFACIGLELKFSLLGHPAYRVYLQFFINRYNEKSMLWKYDLPKTFPVRISSRFQR